MPFITYLHLAEIESHIGKRMKELQNNSMELAVAVSAMLDHLGGDDAKCKAHCARKFGWPAGFTAQAIQVGQRIRTGTVTKAEILDFCNSYSLVCLDCIVPASN